MEEDNPKYTDNKPVKYKSSIRFIYQIKELMSPQEDIHAFKIYSVNLS